MHSGYEAHSIREVSREMLTRDVGIVELNGGHGSYWRTIEFVTVSHPRLYIEHDGLYTSRESAIKAARKIAR